MKVQITHLKAPWPVGAGVGDVVELHSSEVPGWALGKCAAAAADAQVFGPATGFVMTPVADDTLHAASSLADAEEQAAAERSALEAAAASKPGRAKRTAAAG